MKRLLPLLTFFCVAICFGQHRGPGDCAMHSANKSWISSFKKTASIEKQLDMVYGKIIEDSEYLLAHPEIENLDDKRVFGPLPCSTSCTIRFGLLYDAKRGLVLDINKHPELEDLIMEFTSDNIKSIELNELNKRDIYKHVAQKRSGIVLYTTDKELKKRIRKVVKNLNKEEKESKK